MDSVWEWEVYDSCSLALFLDAAELAEPSLGAHKSTQ